MAKHAKEASKEPVLNELLSEEQLDGVSAAGNVIGTDKRDVLRGTSGSDFMYGGDGNDDFRGGGGADNIVGGDGHDRIDGGFGDNSDDLMFGGDGNDQMLWGPGSNNGDDFFDGGDGNDYIVLYGMSPNSVQGALASGNISIELVDSDGNPVEITDSMFSENGNLNVPEGCTGTITGSTGSTLSFTDVELIRNY